MTVIRVIQFVSPFTNQIQLEAEKPEGCSTAHPLLVTYFPTLRPFEWHEDWKPRAPLKFSRPLQAVQKASTWETSTICVSESLLSQFRVREFPSVGKLPKAKPSLDGVVCNLGPGVFTNNQILVFYLLIPCAWTIKDPREFRLLSNPHTFVHCVLLFAPSALKQTAQTLQGSFPK